VKKQKSILILTADTGFGHRNASIAVADALKEIYGIGCDCKIINPIFDRPAPFFLRNTMRDYDETVRKRQAFFKFTYDLSELPVTNFVLEKTIAALLQKLMQSLVEEIQPDAVLSTYHLYNPAIRAALSSIHSSIPFFTIITDLAKVHSFWFQSSPDKIFVATDTVRAEAISRGIDEEKIILSGIPIHPKFTQYTRNKTEIRSNLGWSTELPTILAVGSRRIGNLLQHLVVLNDLRIPVQLAVIAGGDDESYCQLQSMKWHIPAHLYNYVDNISSMMHAADVLISKAGGLIITESLACGLPILLIDFIPGQETGNIAFVCKNQTGAMVQTPKDLLLILENWLREDQKLLKMIASNAARTGRPNAAYQVAETIWEAIQD
jgi:1,2-diacylglycerol 3-beta-galactosyltransferase